MAPRSRFIDASRADGTVSFAPGRSRQRGFTLLEVIIAFAVLGLALTLLLGTLSGAARQVRWSADAGRAALHAQSLIDDIGVAQVFAPGRSEGEFEEGRYRWTLEVSRFNEPARAPQPEALAQPQLFLLALEVAWGDGGPRQRLKLETLRLQSPMQQEGTLQ